VEFQQFYLSCLAQASYLIGSDGVAAVVDPQRDVDLYIEEAARRGLTIRHVIETHLHADFVSGHHELAARTGARIHLGARAGATYPHVDVKEGDEIRFGRCALRFLETPGHTPESISVLVTDLERGPEPFAVLTGDTLFIGDVGRPDLSKEHTSKELAAMLYESLHGKLLTLPDATEVYPAHGAGSLCGRNMSSERRSTIGEQKAANYALRPMPKEAFVEMMTADLPERPEYFARDVEINRAGAAALDELPPVVGLEPREVARRQTLGAVVLDTRTAADFGAGHVPGSVQIGLSGQFASWAGTLLGLDQAIVLVAEGAEHAAEARTRLARVGIENVVGMLDGGLLAWEREGLPVETTPQISVDDLSHELASAEPPQLVDVRRPGEWTDAHVAGSSNRPLHSLMKNLEGLDRRRRVAVQCKSGYRSSVATSLLERAGFADVVNVIGGLDAWRASELPVSDAAPGA
jgi:glyoxylase-like metal-dependent hydrolase (beta-lactamase superfamily II)/rhodanese-related sulfurtransferase